MADLIDRVQEKMCKAARADQLPNEMGSMYKTTFVTGLADLKAIRDYLEQPGRSDRALATKLRHANLKVKALKNDMDAFDALFRTYLK